MCLLYQLVAYAFQIYFLCLLAYALVSWVPSLRGAWSDMLGRIIEPVLVPLRRVIPPAGGLDLSFLILIFAVQLCGQLARNSYATCGLGY